MSNEFSYPASPQITIDDLPSPLREGLSYLLSEKEGDRETFLQVLTCFMESYFNERYEKLLAKMPEKLVRKEREGNEPNNDKKKLQFLQSLAGDDMYQAYTEILNELWDDSQNGRAFFLSPGFKSLISELENLRDSLEKPVLINIGEQEVNACSYLRFLLGAFIASMDDRFAQQLWTNYHETALENNEEHAKVVLEAAELRIAERVNLYQKTAQQTAFAAQLAELINKTRKTSDPKHVWKLFAEPNYSLEKLIKMVEAELKEQAAIRHLLELGVYTQNDGILYKILSDVNQSATARITNFEKTKQAKAEIQSIRNQCEVIIAAEKYADIEKRNARELLKIADNEEYSDIGKLEKLRSHSKTSAQLVEHEIIILQITHVWAIDEGVSNHIKALSNILQDNRLSMSQRLKSCENMNKKHEFEAKEILKIIKQIHLKLESEFKRRIEDKDISKFPYGAKALLSTKDVEPIKQAHDFNGMIIAELKKRCEQKLKSMPRSILNLVKIGKLENLLSILESKEEEIADKFIRINRELGKQLQKSETHHFQEFYRELYAIAQLEIIYHKPDLQDNEGSESHVSKQAISVLSFALWSKERSHSDPVGSTSTKSDAGNRLHTDHHSF